MGKPPLVLASASPRRLELCRLAGLDVRVETTEVELPPRRNEDAAFYVRRMARRKADAVLARLARAPRSASRGEAPGGARARTWVIAADTVVVAEARRILGKPRDRRDARRMLALLLGRSHHVLTGVCVARTGGPRRTVVADTLVVFRPVGEDAIEAYLDTGEWEDKAGAYAAQGMAGARFISSLVGSFTNVVGLPTVELMGILEQLHVL